jgi:hypothetical protein
MDAYLEDSSQRGQYHKLIGQIERFRDVGRAMVKIEIDYPDDAVDMLRLLFAAIRAGLPHGDIRDLRRMFRHDRDRYKELLDQIDTLENQSEATGEASELADPELLIHSEDAESDSDEEEREPPGPNVTNYPKLEITTAIENALDGFEASLTADVLTVLSQVRNRLEVLTDERERLLRSLQTPAGDQIRAALEVVIQWAEQQKTLL